MPKKIKTTVYKKTKVAKNIVLLQIDAPFIAKSAKAGQFVSLSIPNQLQQLLNRPISIHNIEGNYLELLIKVVGPITTIITELNENDSITVLGPFGNDFFIPKNKNILLLGGGIGIAPLYLLEQELLKQGNVTNSLYCVSNRSDIAKINFSNISYHIDSEKNGFATDYLADLLKTKNIDEIKACGPEPLLEQATKIAVSANISIEISLEDVMACGFGACLGCTINTKTGLKKICKDGPIFQGDQIW